jgi:cyclase
MRWQTAFSTAMTLALISGAAQAQTPVPASAAADPVGTGALADRGMAATDFPKVAQIADGVYAYSDVHPSGFTTNSLIVVTSEGVLVADGQGNVEATTKMVDAIKRITSQPIRYVVVCSDHGDHNGGNSAFPATATFIAHPTSQAVFQASAANGRAGAPPVRVPTETVADRRVINMGGKEIHILFEGRAHTGGDLQVYLPRESVLFLSEIYFHRIFPSMRTAFPSEWVEVLRKADAKNVNVMVPGHGFVDAPNVLRSELSQYRRATETVVAEAKRLHALRLPAADAIKQANWGEFAQWTRVEQNAPVMLQKVFDELDGKLPPRP